MSEQGRVPPGLVPVPQLPPGTGRVRLGWFEPCSLPRAASQASRLAEAVKVAVYSIGNAARSVGGIAPLCKK